MSDICQRIVYLRENLGINQSNFAIGLGIKRPTLAGYEKGSFPPHTDFLIKTHKIYNVNIDWLLTGEGEMFLSRQEKALENIPKTGPKRVPVYSESELPEGAFVVPLLDMKYSAGSGSDLPDEDNVKALIRVPSYLSRYGEKIRALPVDGDSMYPTLNRGDLVVCDSNGYSGEGVYAIKDSGEGLIKRITTAEGKFVLLSDNPKYPPREVSKDSENFAVVGRVHCAIKRVE